MQKTSRRREVSSKLAKRRTLELSRESIRTLTSDELPLAVGGSCPTGSWPSDTAKRAQSAC